MNACVCKSFGFYLCKYIYDVITYTLCITSLESLSRTERLKASTIGTSKLRFLLCFFMISSSFFFCYTIYGIGTLTPPEPKF